MNVVSPAALAVPRPARPHACRALTVLASRADRRSTTVIETGDDRQVLLEQLLDPGHVRPAVDARDDLLIDHEHQRRNL